MSSLAAQEQFNNTNNKCEKKNKKSLDLFNDTLLKNERKA